MPWGVNLKRGDTVLTDKVCQVMMLAKVSSNEKKSSQPYMYLDNRCLLSFKPWSLPGIGVHSHQYYESEQVHLCLFIVELHDVLVLSISSSYHHEDWHPIAVVRQPLNHKSQGFRVPCEKLHCFLGWTHRDWPEGNYLRKKCQDSELCCRHQIVLRVHQHSDDMSRLRSSSPTCMMCAVKVKLGLQKSWGDISGLILYGNTF